MTYLDTNILLYAITQDSKYGAACKRILFDIEEGALQVGASTLVLLEVLGALRKINGTRLRKRQPLLDIRANLEAILSLPVVWFEMSVFVIERAANHTMKKGQTADYIHYATAEMQGMKQILSADEDFDQAPGIERLDPLQY